MSAHKDRLIAAADLLGMDPDDLLNLLDQHTMIDEHAAWGWCVGEDRKPAPRGLGVFAHWSVAHDGINVEIDAPEDLPLTVHINDWRAVDVVVGIPGNPTATGKIACAERIVSALNAPDAR